jgi:excisionase family DNA binding protein
MHLVKADKSAHDRVIAYLDKRPDDDLAPPVRVGYSIPEVMTMLGLSRQTIYNLIADGTLRSFKVRNRRLVSPQALEDLVKRAERDA